MNPLLRWFIYGLWSIAALVVAGVILFFLVFLHYDRPTYYDRAHNYQVRRNLERWQQQTRESKEQQAAQTAKQDAYLARITALNTQVESRWRADVEAAHVYADPGVVPPMLEIHESAHSVTVTNKLTDRAVCVRLQRVARRSQRANDYDRCGLDLEVCRELLPQASFRFPQYSTGNPETCMKTALEFRVGTPFSPEPSWWSRSALEDFDARPPPEPLRTQSSELWPLRGDERALNALLAERDRSQRWRRESGPKVDTTRVGKD
jgi:hypothetical protein